MKPIFFATAQQFRAWLQRHHEGRTELLVGFRKRSAAEPGITWREAVDQALCFGWIDGVRRRIDADRYAIRFTPRKPGSTWSAVNIERVAELEKAKQMAAAGRAAFARRSAAKSRTYSYERSKEPELDAELAALLRRHREASAFHDALPPSYRRKIVHWIMAAKSAATRATRLQRLIAAYAKGRRL
jgi:uncharacterized protein YdeI (YjbR/CyaY-like superfamily)